MSCSIGYHFAKGIGLDAKTDPIDAKVISRYAEVVVPQPMATKSDHELKHGALVTRHNQLLVLINQENNRLKQSWDDDAKQSIRSVLEMLKKQLKDVDSKLVLCHTLKLGCGRNSWRVPLP